MNRTAHSIDFSPKVDLLCLSKIKRRVIGRILESIKVLKTSCKRLTKVVYTFTVSTEQWLAFGDRTKAHKVSGTLRAAWGKEWCVEKGVAPTFDGMLKAFDDGDMHWHAYVVQCVDYDTKLFQRLIRAIAS